MEPIKMIFHLPQKESASMHPTEIEVIYHKTSETNLKISECYFESNNILLEIEHNEINTLLDFKNASDYQVLYLDENNFVNGGAYAMNNSIGFKIQTQNKKMLLMYRKPLFYPYK